MITSEAQYPGTEGITPDLLTLGTRVPARLVSFRIFLYRYFGSACSRLNENARRQKESLLINRVPGTRNS